MDIRTTKAKKQLGQNFLKNPKVLQDIATAAELQKDDYVLEIGPGTGNLTKQLHKSEIQYLGLEMDASLKSFLGDFNVQYTDALRFDTRELPENYKLVANIPYYITSPILQHYLMQPTINKTAKPKFMLIMVQKEFAEKICNPEKTSYLQTSLRTVCNPEYLFTVYAQDFYPVPKVDSAVIKLRCHEDFPTEIDLKKFLKFLKVCYSKPRKKLRNNLKPFHELDLDKLPTEIIQERPEDLQLSDLLELFKKINN